MNFPIPSLNEITPSDIKMLNNLCEDEEEYFNLVDNQYVNIYFFYSINGNCEQYKKVVLPLKLSALTKEDFMAEIMKNRNNHGRRFNLSGIYSFKNTLDKDNLQSFVTNPEKSNMFYEYKQVEAISFNKSIEIFQHHNSVFVFLSCDQNKKSRKSFVTPTTNGRKSLKHHE
jgi:hypothetical protein